MDGVMRKIITWVGAVLVLGCMVVSVQAKEFIVLTSSLHIADFARQIAGERMTISSLLRPGVDPHLYVPTPQDVRDIAEADLCLDNGLNLEKDDWLRKYAEEAGVPIATVTGGIETIMITEGGLTLADPHAWMSATNVSVYISNILAQFIEFMPEYKKEFTLRATLYMRQIRALDIWIREQVYALKPEARNLITSHAGFNYFCKEYGFNRFVDSLSISPLSWTTAHASDVEGIPARMSRVVELYVEIGGTALFSETTVDGQYIRVISKETGGRLGGKLYSDSMGNPGGADRYISMMRENIITITRALER